jgi:hypothetical protein
MRQSPGLVVKTGAEGVYIAIIPSLGLGAALKIDDGASRASELLHARALWFQLQTHGTFHAITTVANAQVLVSLQPNVLFRNNTPAALTRTSPRSTSRVDPFAAGNGMVAPRSRGTGDGLETSS